MKEHTCLLCKTVFRYRMERTGKGSGVSIEDAAKSARSDIQWKFKTQNDRHPCPVCGFYQPEMVVGSRRTGHGWTLALSTVTLSVLFGLTLQHYLDPETTTLISCIVAAMATVMHIALASSNPNAALKFNRDTSHQELSACVIQIIEQGAAPAVDSIKTFRLGAGGILAVICVLPLVFGSAAILRVSKGWKYNEGWYPPVAGAGDTPRFYMASRSSLKGMWAGNAGVLLRNAAELGLNPDTLVAESRERDWQDSILLKNDEWDGSAKIYAAVRLFDPAFLKQEGKELRLELSVDAEYPVRFPDDSHKFYNSRVAIIQNAILVLASPGAGETYKTVWLVGHVVGTILVFWFGWFLYQQAKQMSQSTGRVCPCES